VPSLRKDTNRIGSPQARWLCPPPGFDRTARVLPGPHLRRVPLRDTGSLHDLGQADPLEPWEDLAPEQVRVEDGFGMGLLPLAECPFASGDGGAPTPTQLGRLAWVGNDAGVAPHVALVGDWGAAIRTGPEGRARIV